MAPARRHSGHTVEVHTVMAPAMVCLMLAGAIRGFAEALVLAEVSVGVGVEAAAAAEADSVIGGRFKLAFNSLGVNYRKDGYYAKR